LGGLLQRLAPEGEHGVGRLEGVAHEAGLLGVQALGLLAILGRGQVEVARDPHQLVRPERASRAPPAVRHVRLDRPEIATAVEHDGERVAEREPGHAEGDRGRRIRVDEGALEQVLGFVLVHKSSWNILLHWTRERLPAFPAERLGTLGQR
jgi:hypothetical protein